MTHDRRRMAYNERVAARDLQESRIPDVKFVDGQTRRVAVPVVDLLRAPMGPRDRQLVIGETVTVYEDLAGWSFVQAKKDNYVGYVPSSALISKPTPTHRVITRSTHLYPEGNFKTIEHAALSFGSELVMREHSERFFECPEGFVPAMHVAPVNEIASDPAEIAGLFLGTPYLWGGNTGFGIDCSGLVQAACLRCGIPCPGDSDMQENELGTLIGDDEPLKRNDLLFWKGHIALVVDPQTLIHANAYHMSVQYEPIADAIKRIAGQGDGDITSRRRLT